MLRVRWAPALVLLVLVAVQAGPARAADAGSEPSDVGSFCPAGRDSPRRSELEEKVTQLSPRIAEQLGRPLRLPVTIVFDDLYESVDADGDGVADDADGDGVPDVRVSNRLPAETHAVDASCELMTASSAGRPASCRIVVTRRGEGIYVGVDHLIAHEVFHCFQFDIASSAAASGRIQKWLAEGSAAWVGEQISGGSTLGSEFWINWLADPTLPLFDRSYDGIGFFMHLQASGVDPWTILVPMLRRAEISSADAYLVPTAFGEEWVDTWGSSYVRDASLGPDWNIEGISVPMSVPTPIKELRLGARDVHTLEAPPQGTDTARIKVEADAFVIRSEQAPLEPPHGRVRLPDGDERALAEVIGQPFCTRPEGCTCEGGAPGSGHAWAASEKGELLVGVTGHTGGVLAVVEGFDVDKLCGQPPESLTPEMPCWCPSGSFRAPDAAPGLLPESGLAGH